ncbi:non-canonical purine NTP pyrophosphatase [Bradyrhizobium sp. USDA 4454]
MDLRFLTKNDYKFGEFGKLFKGTRYHLVKASVSIDEIQTDDMEALVRDKVVKAFAKTKRPIFVDHTGLQFPFLGGFPGGLTEIFWNKLKNKKLAEIVGRSAEPAVTAITYLAYCDGKKIEVFVGRIDGVIARRPRGPEGFQWDPIFIPNGFNKTFAEMGDQKNSISMRKLAVDKLISYLNENANA